MVEAVSATPSAARAYELTYILRPNVDPADAEKVAERVRDVMAKRSGKITKVDTWGKRRLAYLVKGFSRGIFVHVRFIGGNDLVAELERNLRILEPVMRFLTVKAGDEVDLNVAVDPEEIKFAPIEQVEEEEEPNLEQRLGLSSYSSGTSRDEDSELEEDSSEVSEDRDEDEEK